MWSSQSCILSYSMVFPSLLRPSDQFCEVSSPATWAIQWYFQSFWALLIYSVKFPVLHPELFYGISRDSEPCWSILWSSQSCSLSYSMVFPVLLNYSLKFPVLQLELFCRIYSLAELFCEVPSPAAWAILWYFQPNWTFLWSSQSCSLSYSVISLQPSWTVFLNSQSCSLSYSVGSPVLLNCSVKFPVLQLQLLCGIFCHTALFCDMFISLLITYFRSIHSHESELVLHSSAVSCSALLHVELSDYGFMPSLMRGAPKPCSTTRPLPANQA